MSGENEWLEEETLAAEHMTTWWEVVTFFNDNYLLKYIRCVSVTMVLLTMVLKGIVQQNHPHFI